MFEIFTAIGLAIAAGLNAYIPLLAVGLLSRFTDFLNLPEGWLWLESDVALVIFAVMVVLEFIADKVPVVDSVNDVLQTAIRPASGGALFAVGVDADTSFDSFGAFLESPAIPWMVLGIVLALIPHIFKLIIRPIINFLSAGFGAVASSVIGDIMTVVLIILAIFAPILIPVAIVLMVVASVKLVQRLLRLKNERKQKLTAA